MKNFVRAISLCLVATMLCLALVSCAPAKKAADAVSALKENGYTAAEDKTIVPALLTLAGVKGVDSVVSGTKIVEDKDGNKKAETVTIVYFTDKAQAKEYFDKVEEKLKENKDKDADDSDWVTKRSGAMIYAGTKAAIKAAR